MNLKNQKKQRLSTPRFKQKTLSLVVAAMIYSTPLYAKNVVLDLPSQSLQQSIQQLAQQSGIEIVAATEKLRTKTAPRIKGDMSVDQALETLLQGSGLAVKKQADVYVIVEKASVNAVSASLAQSSAATGVSDEQVHVEMETITVYGDKDRDTQGYDDVYDKNYSAVYAGKDQIERFKGTTPSDLLKGMSNVYSGDARNSGALDPNIRGMQGQGRVPVTIDGTEQSLTVWRGYSGANSRSYIDPNLISSIQVVKGASLNTDIKTGIAGGVAAKTLEVDDIVRPGEKYGAEIKLEGANNTTKERVPTNYTGQDYRDVMDSLGMKNWLWSGFNDPLSMIKPKDSSDNNFANLDDSALRIALATKQEDFDLLAAYAYRSRGNYFSGKKGASFFDTGGGRANISTSTGLVPDMANVYEPGGEVTNTSNRTESYLLKGTWRPTDNQALELIYRDTNTLYGEILPSRISFTGYDGLLPQAPLSEVDTKSYSAEYKYNPDDNRWINLKLNLWQNDTDSNTYTSGGFNNIVLGGMDAAYGYCHPDESVLTPAQITQYKMLCTIYGKGSDRDTSKAYLLSNTAFSSAKNTRKGVSLSNKLELLSNLNLTLGADLTREKLTTTDEYMNDSSGQAGIPFRMLPRAGRRSENQYHFNFDWQPTSWLSLTAGAKSVSYWSFDDFLNKNKDNLNIKGVSSFEKEVKKRIRYTINVDNYTQEMFEDEARSGLMKDSLWFKRFIGKANTYTRVVDWYPDEYGKYSEATNPFLNGTLDINNLGDMTDDGRRYAAYKAGFQIFSGGEVVENKNIEKKKDHKNWAPAVSAAIQLNKNNRLYINYNEAYRLPSLFETTLGFSASQSGYDIKPEHAHNWEVAYVYNMADILKLKQGFADIKLAYFNNRTEDVIERNNRLKFTNVDEQKIAGWELAGRYDNGKYFGDLSLVWNKQNKVCDESSALTLTKETMLYGVNGNYCQDYGFPSGYLVNMALPEYQANLTLGTRLFNQKLELGTRITYYDGFENPYMGTPDLASFNTPLQWDDTLLFDAYMNYRYNENLNLDLIGTNLGNTYYLDAISRSAVAAPGRTVRMGLTYKF